MSELCRSPLPGPGDAASPPFRVAYLRRTEAAQLAPERLLACVHFGPAAGPGVGPEMKAARPWEIVVPLPVLGDGDVVEVWRSARPVERMMVGDVHLACGDDVAFASLCVDDSCIDEGLETVTSAAYRALGAAASASGFPIFARLWNFFPAIHRMESGLERYRAFCRGRHLAFSEHFAAVETNLPAASAIGSRKSGLQVFGLLLRQQGRQIENPRQLSAFHYPPEYGPRSPSFSRSIFKDWGAAGAHLYVSGTASIVGHSSRHHRDYTRQLEETLVNLQALLANADARTGRAFRFAVLRVYSRVVAPLELIRARIAAKFGPETPILVLQGDICRTELLLEIEGLAISD